MSSEPMRGCEQSELVSLYALAAVSPNEARVVEAHVTACAHCREQIETLRAVVDAFAAWPTDVLRPSPALWNRLTERVGIDPASSACEPWDEPDWEVVAPGLSVKLLATDTERDRVSMLVRLDRGVEYPPHRHGGVEELHLLHGELFIDDKKLRPGDYIRADPGTVDRRVWTETGCTCVLITSPSDELR